jgi:hypothetical protein
VGRRLADDGFRCRRVRSRPQHSWVRSQAYVTPMAGCHEQLDNAPRSTSPRGSCPPRAVSSRLREILCSSEWDGLLLVDATRLDHNRAPSLERPRRWACPSVS